MYAGMSEENLGAIYTYLMSIEPIKNKIEKKFIPASDAVAIRQVTYWEEVLY